MEDTQPAEEASTTPACDQVWGIVELRDMILLHLPLTDLIRARRVCKDWEQSEEIKEALFLRPRGSSRVEAVGANDWTLVNPLSAKSQAAQEEEEAPGQPMHSGPLLNPFMLRQTIVGGIYLIGILQHYFSRAENTLYEFEGIDGPWTEEHASWKNMQVTQPAASSISFRCLGNDVDATCYEYDGDLEGDELESMKQAYENPVFLTVHNPNGVTWGQLTSDMNDHHERCDHCQNSAADNGCPEYDWEYQGAWGVRKIGPEITGYEILAEIKKCTERKKQDEVADPKDHQEGAGGGEQDVDPESGDETETEDGDDTEMEDGGDTGLENGDDSELGSDEAGDMASDGEEEPNQVASGEEEYGANSGRDGNGQIGGTNTI